MITVGNDLVRDHLHAERKWFILLGVILVIIGILLLGMLPFATLSVVYFFGLLMMLGGILHLLASFTLFKSNSRWFWALFSIFYFMAGYFAFSSPDRAALVLTTLLSFFLVFAGVIRMANATVLRAIPGWKWTFFSGLLTFITGLLIMFTPDAPFWVLGMFLAIDVLFQGINYLTIASVIKQIPVSSKTIE
ncbi:HdeD family acid-resistance protein [Acinetobacter puyangensis]|uniref:HdeD family acid-resistance protein n=1 Tax=Acinetobacter puyangensis TaxID=1096779 RepID=UPI003A4DD082